ncbi:hypothetical protein POPTR_010G127900v4 [Populus trichocarpa]|uniref:Uncharacterized protein n=2 Tax=Populus trichocarpa TaxID=3694 RepID=B9HWK6_POPTR|nr:uncharacterized protein LOC127905807 [Populus trichocarpa]KAI9387149.1 hypothetical protein POPTR_010G127900v4 [Populus trichocarpa]PNT16234.1 hypothetical protein POPTR_010G127900v4 [Populus trichocarpa]
MEFHCSSHTRSERQMGTDPNLEFEGVEYSDVYYAELKKQILLLTADDDEEVDVTNHSRLVDIQRKQDSNSLTNSFPTTLQPGSYFNWWERQKTDLVPTWPENLWRSNGNGTGVFIPQIVKSRRYRRGGVNNVRRRYTSQWSIADS